MTKTKRSKLDSAVPIEFRLTEEEFLKWLERWDCLTWQIARRYTRRQVGLDLEEVYNEVQSGFFEASVRYDKRRDISFQTYAYYYGAKAARELVRGRHNQGFTYIGPRHAFLEQRALYLSELLKLDREIGLSDIVENRDEEKDPHDLVGIWDKVRKYLPKRRYSRILELRYLEGKTLEEASREVGGTREAVRQIQNKALRLLSTHRFLATIGI